MAFDYDVGCFSTVMAQAPLTTIVLLHHFATGHKDPK